MARIRYTGNLEHRIPGVGPIGPNWLTVPDDVAAEHDNPADKAAGWEVDRDKEPDAATPDSITRGQAARGRGDAGKDPELETENSELKTVAPGGDA